MLELISSKYLEGSTKGAGDPEGVVWNRAAKREDIGFPMGLVYDAFEGSEFDWVQLPPLQFPLEVVLTSSRYCGIWKWQLNNPVVAGFPSI